MSEPAAPVPEFSGDKPEVRPVKVAGRSYTIHEMDGPSLTAWMKFQATRVKTDRRNNVTEATDFRDFQATLISYCLRDEEGKKVPKSTIGGWFSNTLTGLFKICQEVNGLDDEALDRVKKASPTETDSGTA